LTLLSIAAQLALLLPRQLVQLLLQLLGFAPQHFLLPALLRSLLRVLALLLRQFLLALRKLLQLLQRIVDLLLALLLRRLRPLVAFVLVLLGIQLQIEQTFEVARTGAAASPAATALPPEGHLDIT